MKRLAQAIFMVTILTFSLTSCREQTEKERVIEDMKDDGASMEVKDGGDKIKMKTEDKEVKIKTDDDGDTKIKTDDN